MMKRVRLNATALILAIAISAPAAAAEWFTAALPSHPTCHGHSFDAAALAAHPNQKVSSLSLERNARDIATERQWGKLEQFDGTPVISATLHVHFRNDPVSHSVRLECERDASDDDAKVLICTTPSCPGGQLQISGDGKQALSLSVGGTLKNGQFLAHYIHLDESCEAHAGGPIVLESGTDDHSFDLTPVSRDDCK